jgi:hypothetical protein
MIIQNFEGEGVSESEIGTWVPMPEANLPY